MQATNTIDGARVALPHERREAERRVHGDYRAAAAAANDPTTTAGPAARSERPEAWASRHAALDAASSSTGRRRSTLIGVAGEISPVVAGVGHVRYSTITRVRIC